MSFSSALGCWRRCPRECRQEKHFAGDWIREIDGLEVHKLVYSDGAGMGEEGPAKEQVKRRIFEYMNRRMDRKPRERNLDTRDDVGTLAGARRDRMDVRWVGNAGRRFEFLPYTSRNTDK